MMISKKCRPWLPSPTPLVTIAGNIINNKSMPDCWDWNINDVLNWLQRVIKLPQYRECFSKNFINGRLLLLVNATVCTKIGIHNFEHIQLITSGIRRLYNMEKVKPNRSISLPPNEPWTHYLLYRVPRGPKRETTTPTQLFQMMGILDPEKPCPNHWDTVLPPTFDFPYNRFGGIKFTTTCVNEAECLCHINNNS